MLWSMLWSALDAVRRVLREARRMDVILHMERGTEPATGWLKEGPESTSLMFIGYTELLALLEALRAKPPVGVDDAVQGGACS